jgi:hypothetical protein
MRYLLVLSVFLAAGAFAQEPAPAPAAAPEATAAPAPKDAPSAPEVAGEQVDPKELLEQVMMARISKELALDDDQAVLLVKRFSEYREQMSVMRKKRFETMKDLKQVVKDTAKDEDLKAKLDTLIALDEESSLARKELFESLSSGLTEWQRARLYIFLTEFEGDMRRYLQRARERYQGQSGDQEGFRRWREHGEPGDKERGPREPGREKPAPPAEVPKP